jgi:hypothetical protein
MKRYTEMSHAELVAMDDEGVEKLIELEVAHEGIVPAERPTEPLIEDAGIERKDIAYKVGSMMFRNREDAEAVAKMHIVDDHYDYGIGYDWKWLKVVKVDVTEERFYLKDDVARVKDALVDLERRKKRYESEDSAWDKYVSKTTKIRTKVWAAVNDAQDFERKLELARKTLEKHTALADGDEKIARRFFVNAYRNQYDVLEHVLGMTEAELDAIEKANEADA